MLVGYGCSHSSPSAGGPPIGRYEDFRPATSPPTNAQLTMAGVSIPVIIRVNSTGTQVRVVSLQDGKQVDQEIYDDNGSTFALAHAAGENFQPPLPLLNFPMHIGDSWDWSGTTTLENSTHPAKAAVRTSVSRTVIKGSPENAVEVDVDLQMGLDTPTVMRRQLKFWFVKGQGIVRRSFGEESVREPREPSRKGASP